MAPVARARRARPCDRGSLRSWPAPRSSEPESPDPGCPTTPRSQTVSLRRRSQAQTFGEELTTRLGGIGRARGSRSADAWHRTGRSRRPGHPAARYSRARRRDRARSRIRHPARSPGSPGSAEGSVTVVAASKCSGQSWMVATSDSAGQRRQHVVEDTPRQGEPVGDPGHDPGRRGRRACRAGPTGGVSSPQLNGRSTSTSTKPASWRRVDPLIGARLVEPPTSRTSVVPEIRTVSGSSPNAGVVMPPGPARRPKRPLTTKRRRARMWAAIVWSDAPVADSGFIPAWSRGPGPDRRAGIVGTVTDAKAPGACRPARRRHRPRSTSTSPHQVRTTAPPDERRHEKCAVAWQSRGAVAASHVAAGLAHAEMHPVLPTCREQSSHPVEEGVGSAIWSMWLHVGWLMSGSVGVGSRSNREGSPRRPVPRGD